MDLLSSPFTAHFDRFLDTLSEDCLICTPYLSVRPAQRLVEKAQQRGILNSLQLRIVTDISVPNVASGATDLAALQLLMSEIADTRTTYIPRVHAKVYVSGSEMAVIGSANFTNGGFEGNLEYGVCITDAAIVQGVRRDVEGYAAFGGTVTRESLDRLSSTVEELRQAVRDEQHSIDRKVREAAVLLQRQLEDDLIRIRVAGRTANAIFEDTLMHLLASGRMTTIQLHQRIQAMHPDLCDDTVDRVIDGEHYGKLWKHRVRTAQQHLKKRGLIVYDKRDSRWGGAR